MRKSKKVHLGELSKDKKVFVFCASTEAREGIATTGDMDDVTCKLCLRKLDKKYK